jgi:hypothetical protein
MILEIELRCILFPLIILEVVLQLEGLSDMRNNIFWADETKITHWDMPCHYAEFYCTAF